MLLSGQSSGKNKGWSERSKDVSDQLFLFHSILHQIKTVSLWLQLSIIGYEEKSSFHHLPEILNALSSSSSGGSSEILDLIGPSCSSVSPPC